MRARKRHRESSTPPPPVDPEKYDDPLQGADDHNDEQPDNASDSDGGSYSSGEGKDEFIVVKRAEVRKEVQCAICLGIIRRTRTVMECLHRFCRECIDKSMRLGNNECPACRTHCASRRSLRDDPNYDALIAALYPDFDRHEEEEMVYYEEEKAHNKQIQASIAQTLCRQIEALGKKRTSVRGTGARRGRRNHRCVVHRGSDEEEGADWHYDSKESSADEKCAEPKSKRYKRCRGAQTSKPSSGPNAEFVGVAWGRGGTRSNTRNGAQKWTNDRICRSIQVSKLSNHLRSLHEENEVLKTSVMMVSLHEEKIPKLKRPYLCCSPTSSVRHLCQYVAMQTSMEGSEIEMLLIKDLIFTKESINLDSYQNNNLQLLEEHQTLEEIHARFTQQHLVLAYRPKLLGS